jgi:DNA-3-methyladenine glycosylase II
MAFEKLDSADALDLHLKALLKRDQRLGPILKTAGAFEIRRTDPGFAGLAKVICGQQLSVASASAIWGRFAALDGALTPASYLALSEAEVRGVGFSLGKYRTVRALAEAVVNDGFDFELLEAVPAEEAIARLTAIKGIGPWTAELYLMFCANHPDLFPSGDLALQKAVAHAFKLEVRPVGKALDVISAAWAPHRAAAALLFWRYYKAMGMNSGVLL